MLVEEVERNRGVLFRSEDSRKCEEELLSLDRLVVDDLFSDDFDCGVLGSG